jgi:signal recognition particle subunit SRP54
MASRILGMGDVLTLIDKAQAAFDEKQAAELEQKMRQQTFTLDDYLAQLNQIKSMGNLDQIMAMMPGMKPGALKDAKIDEKMLAHTEAIIHSMTPRERVKPEIINASRKKRIAAGSGTSVEEVNKVLRQFEQMLKMMKQFSDMGRTKKGQKMLGRMKLPF